MKKSILIRFKKLIFLIFFEFKRIIMIIDPIKPVIAAVIIIYPYVAVVF